MGHPDIPLRKSVLQRIATWSVAAEILCLLVLSSVPIDVGFPPGTSPVVLRLAEIVVLIHYPALLVGFHVPWGRAASYGWWSFAFLIGYAEIVLLATVVYWSAVIVSRAWSRGRTN
jgi:hypothetical protein